MERCWKDFPRELLSGVFRYLGYLYVKTELIRWMSTSDIVHMLNDTSFEMIVEAKNYTGCILYKKYNPRCKIDWNKISKNYILSTSFIERYHNHLDWYWLSYKQQLSERIIDFFSNKVDWWNISIKQTLSDEFILKYNHKIIKRLRPRPSLH